MGVFVGFVIILLLGIFWGGYITSLLWGWFMVPLGVKAITYWHAVGLGPLFSMFLGSRGIATNEDSSAGGKCHARARHPHRSLTTWKRTTKKMLTGLFALVALAAVAPAVTHWIVGILVFALPVGVTYVRLKLSPSYRASTDQCMGAALGDDLRSHTFIMDRTADGMRDPD